MRITPTCSRRHKKSNLQPHDDESIGLCALDIQRMATRTRGKIKGVRINLWAKACMIEKYHVPLPKQIQDLVMASPTKELKSKKSADERSEKIKVGLYAEKRDVEYLLTQAGGVSITAGMNILIQRQMALESAGLMALVRKFTPDEWKFMAVILKVTPMRDELFMDKNVLCKMILDCRTLDFLVDMYQVGTDQIIAKISLLNELQTMALNCRIRDLWNKYPIGKEIPDATFKKWSDF